MKITVESILAKDLKPGDLFTTQDQEYWDFVNKHDKTSVGQKVYIRTTNPCPENQEAEVTYKITILVQDEEKTPTEIK